MRVFDVNSIRIEDPMRIPVPVFARASFAVDTQECILLLTNSAEWPFADLVVGGATATAVFCYGGRIPSTYRSHSIAWYGTGKYKAGVIHQSGEWWTRWRQKTKKRQERFKSLRTILFHYDTETNMAIYGFEKPGVFAIRIRAEDRPGELSKIAKTINNLHLDIISSISAIAGKGQTFQLVCGTSRPITPQEIERGLLSSLGQSALSVEIEGDALTEEGLKIAEGFQSLLSVFISYSHNDRLFVLRLHDFLVNSGVKCWLDDHELTPGDKLHEAIRSGIQQRDRVLLVCSRSSLQSWWVDNELEEALAKERESKGRSLLMPVDIDGAILQNPPLNDKCTQIRSRYIGDFVGWRDNAKFAESATRLLRALTAKH